MLVRERLGTAPSDEAINLLFGPRLENGLKDFDHMLRVHKAHTVMLTKTGIIGEEVGNSLAGVLLALQDAGIDSLELDPKLEDLFYNIEAFITNKVGARIAGQLHTGRSRNDLGAAIHRLHTRDHILSLLNRAMDLRSALLTLAESNVDTVMPGYTHLKPAQPITLGYYLSAVANALERDTIRVARVYESVNLNPLGAAALAGTSFPVDREMTANLLGFDGVVENCLDAIASRDYVLELLSALAIITTTLTRLAGDFYIWQSDEFGMLELGDAIAGTSSIMPQKKNPHPLEQTKGRAPQVYGALMASLSAAKATIFSNNQESGGAGVQQQEMAVYESSVAMGLMAMVMRNVEFDTELMYERTTKDFSTVTELADLIVKKFGISFREAHGIVGGTVMKAVRSNLKATEITIAMLNEESLSIIGSELDLTAEEVAASLEPRNSVAGKPTLGGPNPDQVKRMIQTAWYRLDSEANQLEQRKQHIEESLTNLDRETKALSKI